MRKIMIAALLATGAALAPAPALAHNDADVFGDWAYRENGSVVRIYACGHAICVRIVRIRDRGRRDIHNPNVRLRSRPVIGVVIASKARKIGKASWRGNLYNTLDGGTYRGTVNLVDQNTITLVGCYIGTVFCEAKTLFRTKPRGGETTVAARRPSRSVWKTYNTRH